MSTGRRLGLGYRNVSGYELKCCRFGINSIAWMENQVDIPVPSLTHGELNEGNLEYTLKFDLLSASDP